MARFKSSSKPAASDSYHKTLKSFFLFNSRKVQLLSQFSSKRIFLAAIVGCCLFTVTQVESKDINGFPQNFQAGSKDGNRIGGKTAASPAADPTCDLFYMIVSTIDGKVSALDLHQKGKAAWTLEADSKPLYSSTLSNIKMVRNKKEMRLIPSLDGALYQFDGEKVEAIPVSADTLLSSTYRLSDDSMVVGSKELKSFGIEISSGQVIFQCGSEGCHQRKNAAEEGSIDGNDVLIITRDTQTVRSVDIKNGQEKWNFSVGQHEIRLPPRTKTSQIDDKGFEDDTDNDDTNENEGIPVFTSFRQCPHEEKYASDPDFENFLRLSIPEGKVVALDKGDASLVSWEHKFESPIAKAWLYRNGELEAMSLFDGRYVPTLTSYATEDQENESMPKPLLYIGSHQNLPYIQASPQMETVLKSFPNSKIGHAIHPKINVAWRPYLNTASARTPIFSGNWPGQQHIGNRQPVKDNLKPTTSLAVWHEEYPFDTGFFLFPEFRDSRSPRKGYIRLIEQLRKPGAEEELTLMTILLTAFWIYWKEVIAIFIITLTMPVMMIKFFKINIMGNPNSNNSHLTSDSHESKSESQDFVVNDSSPRLRSSVSEGQEYISRFATDFDCLQCLGKGGFGVVFEAVNKVDDQHYAVKRIMLPKSDGAKEKVLREVKALAKLEHTGIVRYFNAWVESPPAGWQEERDQNFLPSDLSGTNFSPTPSISLTPKSGLSSRLDRKACSDHKAIKLQASKAGGAKQLKPGAAKEATLDEDLTTDSIVFAPDTPEVLNMQPAGSSGEFSIHSNLADSSTGSWSGQGASRDNIVSFGLHTISSSGDSSVSDSRSSIPFSNYSSNSSVTFSQRHTNFTDNDMTGDSVVFESSSCNQSIGAESVIFAESSHMPAGSNLEIARPKSTDHAIDILSSHDDDDKEKKEEKKTPQISHTSLKLFLYIQMQLYRKDTLLDWLGNNTLNRDRQTVLTIFDQIVCAVDYVHKQGLMHRDLKPSNIFFSADGNVKVGDFGLVTALTVQHDQEMAVSALSSDKHTADVGTTTYMSPEQIANRPYDLKVDIFSMGLIFLELWIPFATQMERVRTLHAAKKQSLPERFLRELPTESDLVRKMTCEDPKCRPVTDEILDHDLFQDIASQRTDQRARKRTVSEKSS